MSNYSKKYIEYMYENNYTSNHNLISDIGTKRLFVKEIYCHNPLDLVMNSKEIAKLLKYKKVSNGEVLLDLIIKINLHQLNEFITNPYISEEIVEKYLTTKPTEPLEFKTLFNYNKVIPLDFFVKYRKEFTESQKYSVVNKKDITYNEENIPFIYNFYYYIKNDLPLNYTDIMSIIELDSVFESVKNSSKLLYEICKGKFELSISERIELINSIHEKNPVVFSEYETGSLFYHSTSKLSLENIFPRKEILENIDVFSPILNVEWYKYSIDFIEYFSRYIDISKFKKDAYEEQINKLKTLICRNIL